MKAQFKESKTCVDKPQISEELNALSIPYRTYQQIKLGFLKYYPLPLLKRNKPQCSSPGTRVRVVTRWEDVPANKKSYQRPYTFESINCDYLSLWQRNTALRCSLRHNCPTINLSISVISRVIDKLYCLLNNLPADSKNNPLKIETIDLSCINMFAWFQLDKFNFK